MDRRFFPVWGLIAVLACGCGGQSSGSPTPAPVIDSDGAPDEPAPELPVPTVAPEPEATPTPFVLTTQWESLAAVYLAPPADGVLRAVGELSCVEDGLCPDIVLIACSGTTVRVDTRVQGENHCRTLPESSYDTGEFLVRTDGIYDPETREMTFTGATEAGDSFGYEYTATVRLSPDGNSLTGTGAAGYGAWPLVITATRVIPDEP